MLQKLETEKVLACHLILQQFLNRKQGGSVLVLRVTLSCITQEGNLALVKYQDCYFREIHFFPFSVGLSPVSGSHCQPCPAGLLCRRIWQAVPEWEGCWSWRLIWRVFVFHWLPPTEDCFESGQLLNTLSTCGSFSVTVSGEYILYKKVCSHVISWYHMDFSRAWCPFGYCFCFRNFSAVLLPLCNLSLPFAHLLSPVRASKITKSWYILEEKALTLCCLLHTRSLGFYTCICPLASESWKVLGYLFEVSNECQEVFCSWKWRKRAEADKSALSCWSLEHMNQNRKHKRYMEYKTEFSVLYSASRHFFRFPKSHMNCDRQKGQNDVAKFKERGGVCPVWIQNYSLSLAR